MYAQFVKKEIDKNHLSGRMTTKKYFKNCFLLLIPIFIWNLLLYSQLPVGYQSENFDKDIPTPLSYGENILRIVIFGFPILMILNVQTKKQKIGLALFILGTLIYFSSWLALIIEPISHWSLSKIGFLAPAYSTIIWLVGIALIGNKSFLKINKVSLIYFVLSVLFVAVHTWHALIAYQNI
jgi:hypothetical protein